MLEREAHAAQQGAGGPGQGPPQGKGRLDETGIASTRYNEPGPDPVTHRARTRRNPPTRAGGLRGDRRE